MRWFILSAQQGLVSPDEVLEPYELRLSKTAREYRREWGQRVVNQLGDTMLGTVTASELRLSVGDTGFEPVSSPAGVTGADLRFPASDLRRHRTVARNLPERNGNRC